MWDGDALPVTAQPAVACGSSSWKSKTDEDTVFAYVTSDSGPSAGTDSEQMFSSVMSAGGLSEDWWYEERCTVLWRS